MAMFNLKNTITKVQDYSKNWLEIKLSEIKNEKEQTMYHLTITSNDNVAVDMSFQYQSSAEYYIMGFTRWYEFWYKEWEKDWCKNR